jgi:hypothetical protein
MNVSRKIAATIGPSLGGRGGWRVLGQLRVQQRKTMPWPRHFSRLPGLDVSAANVNETAQQCTL